MSLFKRKKVVKHVEEYAEEKTSFVTAESKIYFCQVTDSDEENRLLVEKLKSGIPLCINFEEVSVQAGNKILAFLVGATYAIGGRSFLINEKSYLFVRNEELADGSIMRFLEKFKN